MNRRGFTLVELIAVISIIALVLALSLPAMNLFRSQALLKRSAAALQSMLQEARSLAIAQQKTFSVRLDPNEESAVILDGATPVNKKWFAPAAVDITDISGGTAVFDLQYKTNGGTNANISVHLKRRDANPADATKYYTVTVINTTGVPRIYSTKQN